LCVGRNELAQTMDNTKVIRCHFSNYVTNLYNIFVLQDLYPLFVLKKAVSILGRPMCHETIWAATRQLPART
jgi:hypothetical protein